MRTRKALVVLKNGRAVEIGNMDDATWAEYLRFNRNWLSGKSGPVDLLNNGELMASFDYADVERIDLWPGSEEPW